MFNKEFYPTPLHVLEQMQIDCAEKVVLEPSAGKGDIIDFCKKNGARNVLAFEINKDLQKIVEKKSHLLGSDFLECTAEQISHVEVIVMNPPFSNADEHIMHAYNIAPEGCEVIALCNWETIDKAYTRSRRKLQALIENYGLDHNLGSCFDTAERKTGVEVGLVRLFKPTLGNENSFDGFFMDEDEEELQSNEVLEYNEVRALVNRYVGAMKYFDELHELRDKINYTTSGLGMSSIDFTIGYNEKVTTKEEFSKYMQKTSWKHIFNKMNMKKYVTSGVMRDINRFVENQQKYPFTMKNVYRMFEIIIGTRQQTYNRALEEIVDKFTEHTSENRFGVEGWKTNSGYMLNHKFIINWMVKPTYNGDKLELMYNGNTDKIEDLVKVLCNITGQNYDNHKTINQFFRDLKNIDRGVWYSWGFFEFKAFKKGTIHFKFQNKEDWYMLNKAYGELKGFTLSTEYKKSA